MHIDIHCPVVTILKNGRIDYDAQGKQLERLIEAGIDGVLLSGSIGEFHAMPVEMKTEYWRWATRIVGGRIKVMAGTGDNVLSKALFMTETAKDIGMDGAVVISPYYFRLGDAALRGYYEAIARVGLPICLYNFPDRTGHSLSPALIRHLACEHPAIQALKDTVDSISHTREVIDTVKKDRPDFKVWSGFDEYLVANALAGGDGVLTGMTNVAPQLFTALRESLIDGDLATIQSLQQTIGILMRLYTVTDPFIPAIKEAVSLVGGGFCTQAMPPTPPATSRERQKVRDILTEAKLLS